MNKETKDTLRSIKKLLNQEIKDNEPNNNNLKIHGKICGLYFCLGVIDGKLIGGSEIE